MVDKIRNIILATFLFTFYSLSAEQKRVMITDLNDLWKFKIGDNKEWAKTNYNDSEWDIVDVPSRWEDEGYNGYDGYAWYRKEFRIKQKYLTKNLYLSLGVVDDVAEIYINGNLVGVSGSFPPKYETAYNNKIWLPIPRNLLSKNSTNVIAVRVYDEWGEGGIYKGNVGVYTYESPLNLLINLEGRWKFKTGNNFIWKNNNFNDSNWEELVVPSMWDSQGYRDYDGFAWYRLTFSVDLNNKNFDDDLVLMLGKIDDIDETYLNEKFIGSTGDLLIMPLTHYINNSANVEYDRIRGYRINRADLNNGKNVIAVRVYDGFQYGGIYEGPIGITMLEDYVKFRTRDLDKKKKSFIEEWFNQ